MVTAVRDVLTLHSSDPTTPHLALWARVPGFTTDDLDHALARDRDLWRLHAMRRTLWICATDEAGMLDAAVGRKVARAERRRVEGWLAAEIGQDAVGAWLDRARDDVLALLAADVELRTQDISEALPDLQLQLTLGSGKYTQQSPISTRLLYTLGMELDVVRTSPAGSWRSSQYAWSNARDWFGDRHPGEPPSGKAGTEATHAAQARLVERYLDRFGPATALDVQWWSGMTKTDTARALSAVGAVEVDVEQGGPGFLLPTDDPDADAPVQPGTVTLLPSLDPTAMGWKVRDHHLDPEHLGDLIDRNGNVAPTIWLDGMVIGGWAVRGDDDRAGEVVTEVLADVGTNALAAVDHEAERLTAWLDGTPVTTRFPTPIDRRLRA